MGEAEKQRESTAMTGRTFKPLFYRRAGDSSFFSTRCRSFGAEQYNFPGKCVRDHSKADRIPSPREDFVWPYKNCV